MKRLIPLFLIAITAAGCATSRSEIALERSYADHSRAENTKGDVFIRSVTDGRTFEEAPSTPNIPSLGFGGASAAPQSLRLRAVGRKRNTYGKALGDVMLKGSDVVELVFNEVADALTESGYRVSRVPSGVDRQDELTLDLEIDKFWSWFNPGFWAITLKSEVAVDFQVDGHGTSAVSVVAEEKRQAATDGAWKEILNAALDKLRERIKSELPGLLAAAPRSAETDSRDACVASALKVASPDLRTKAVAACGSAN